MKIHDSDKFFYSVVFFGGSSDQISLRNKSIADSKNTNFTGQIFAWNGINACNRINHHFCRFSKHTFSRFLSKITLESFFVVRAPENCLETIFSLANARKTCEKIVFQVSSSKKLLRKNFSVVFSRELVSDNFFSSFSLGKMRRKNFLSRFCSKHFPKKIFLPIFSPKYHLENFFCRFYSKNFAEKIFPLIYAREIH